MSKEIRSREEIVQEALAIQEQMKEIGQWDNPSAYKQLSQRLLALLWVLKYPKSPEKLTLTEKQLKLLQAFW